LYYVALAKLLLLYVLINQIQFGKSHKHYIIFTSSFRQIGINGAGGN